MTLAMEQASVLTRLGLLGVKRLDIYTRGCEEAEDGRDCIANKASV